MSRRAFGFDEPAFFADQDQSSEMSSYDSLPKRTSSEAASEVLSVGGFSESPVFIRFRTFGDYIRNRICSFFTGRTGD